MSYTPPPPPPGSWPIAEPPLLAQTWSRFRRLPVWVQVVGWLLLWPLLCALLIVRGERPSRIRYALAMAVLLVGAVVYIPSGDGAAEQQIALALAAEEEVLAADEAAATIAEAAAEKAATAARAAAEEDSAARAAEEAAARAAEEEAAARAAGEDAVAAAVQSAARAAEAASIWTVFNVVDGDTIDVRHADGAVERVRVIGIDTPERGECNFSSATSAMQALVGGREVVLSNGARDDRDRYGRILRYVDVDEIDAGLTLIEDGLAIARYDSRDGYGSHPRESGYVTADAASTQIACPAPAPEPTPAPEPASEPEPAPPSSVHFKNCDAARAAGAAPVYRGDTGYGSHLDRDNDGIGCE
jgi:endonuclease YncB( thermonuclease family)